MIKILLGKIFLKQLERKMKRKDVENIKMSIWKANLINLYLESINY